MSPAWAGQGGAETDSAPASEMGKKVGWTGIRWWMWSCQQEQKPPYRKKEINQSKNKFKITYFLNIWEIKPANTLCVLWLVTNHFIGPRTSGLGYVSHQRRHWVQSNPARGRNAHGSARVTQNDQFGFLDCWAVRGLCDGASHHFNTFMVMLQLAGLLSSRFCVFPLRNISWSLASGATFIGAGSIRDQKKKSSKVGEGRGG